MLTVKLDPIKQFILSVYPEFRIEGRPTEINNQNLELITEGQGTEKRVFNELQEIQRPEFVQRANEEFKRLDSNSDLSQLIALTTEAETALLNTIPTEFKTISEDPVYNGREIPTKEFLDLLMDSPISNDYELRRMSMGRELIGYIKNSELWGEKNRTPSQQELLSSSKLMQSTISGFLKLPNASELIEFQRTILRAKVLITFKQSTNHIEDVIESTFPDSLKDTKYQAKAIAISLIQEISLREIDRLIDISKGISEDLNQIATSEEHPLSTAQKLANSRISLIAPVPSKEAPEIKEGTTSKELRAYQEYVANYPRLYMYNREVSHLIQKLYGLQVGVLHPIYG